MAKEVPSLGELEIRVLRLVWEHQPCTERHISDLIQADRDVARTTVLKTMQALVRRFVDTILGGSADPLVAYLADAGRLSGGDLEALRTIARKLDRDGE